MKSGEAAYKYVTSKVIELGFGLLVVRTIPCYNCKECLEIFYTGDVMQIIETIIAEAKRLIQEIRAVYFEGTA